MKIRHITKKVNGLAVSSHFECDIDGVFDEKQNLSVARIASALLKQNGYVEKIVWSNKNDGTRFYLGEIRIDLENFNSILTNANTQEIETQIAASIRLYKKVKHLIDACEDVVTEWDL